MKPHAAPSDEEQVREYLALLTPPARQRLADALGVPSRGAGAPDPSAVAAALLDEVQVGRAVDALPPDARGVVLFCAGFDAGGSVDSDTSSLAALCGWRAPRCTDAFEAAFSSGLMRRPTEWGWSAAPSIRPALARRTFEWLAGVAPESAVPLPWPFLLAAVTAYAFESPPRIRSHGGLYTKWMDKATERLAYPDLGDSRVEQTVDFLGSLGLLAHVSRAGTHTLVPVWEGIGPVLEAPAEDLGLASCTASLLVTTLGLFECALHHPCGESRRIAEARGVSRSEIEAEARSLALRADTFDIAPEVPHPFHIAQGLRYLVESGVLEVDRSGAEPRFRRRARGSAAPAARWVVQPNFDVLVPEDAPPAAVARLGAVAELVRLDRVARFTVTSASVRRGVALLAGRADPVDVLASNASCPLPDNVVATVRGWAQRATPMKPYLGAVIVAGTDEQAVFLRRRKTCHAEVAPNVFLFPPGEIGRVLDAAAKAGHASTALTEETGYYGDRWHQGSSGEEPSFAPTCDARDSAAQVLDAVRRWASLAAAEESGRHETLRASSAAGLAAWLRFDGERLPTMRDVTTADVDAFMRAHGWVHHSVASNPKLLAVAIHVAEHRLRELDALNSPEAVRERLEDVRAAFQQAHAGAAPAAEAPLPHSDDAGPWETPAPGELARLLTEAAVGKRDVQLLYVNSLGSSASRVVLPLEVRDGARPTLRAHCRDSNGPCDFLLERISAIRPVV